MCVCVCIDFQEQRERVFPLLFPISCSQLEKDGENEEKGIHYCYTEEQLQNMGHKCLILLNPLRNRLLGWSGILGHLCLDPTFSIVDVPGLAVARATGTARCTGLLPEHPKVN